MSEDRSAAEDRSDQGHSEDRSAAEDRSDQGHSEDRSAAEDRSDQGHSEDRSAAEDRSDQGHSEDRSAPHLGDELSALLDGELAAPRVAAAQRHLAGCPACAAELARVGQAREWVRRLPAVEPPGGLIEGIVAGPTAAVTPLRRRRRALVSVAACVAAAGAVLVVSPPEEPPTSPPVGRLVEAHATGGPTGEPLTQLVPVGVPVSFGR